MLSPADFFDLNQFAHSQLFQGVRYVWEAVRRIGSYLAATLAPGVSGIVMSGAHVGPDVSVGEGTIIEPGAMIAGPAMIGSNCRIRHGSYIRGNVIVGDGAVVGHGTELKNAALLDKCHVTHFNYVGDTILGNGVSLGAGTICANRKVTRGDVIVKVEGDQFKTGMARLGAIVGDSVRIGANACLAPGTLVGRDSLAYPLAALLGYYPPGSLIKTRQQIEVAEYRR